MPMQQLTMASIQSILAFQLDPAGGPGNWRKSRPAFRITLADGTFLVLKGEMRAGHGATAHESVRWGGKMMKQVSPQAKATMLTPNELNVLLALPTTSFATTKTQQYVQELVQSNMFVFYKMPFVDNLRATDTMLQQGKAAKLLAKLKGNRNALLQLGRIVAVDMFIGNEDRFNMYGRIANEGNIVFQKNAVDKTYMPVGIDFFDAQKQAASVYRTPPDPWSGSVLMNDSTLRRFSKAAIGSLNDMFRQSLPPPVTDNQLLPLLAAGTFLRGMAQGREELKDYLVRKHRLANSSVVVGRARGQVRGLPPGVITRMRLLGWIQ